MPRSSVRRAAAGAVLGLTLAVTALGTAPAALAADLPAPVVTPSTVNAGQSFTVTGIGCSTIDGDVMKPQVGLFAPKALQQAVLPASDGSWSMTSTIPADLAAGKYVLELSCDGYTSSRLYAPVTITVGGATAPVAATGLTVAPGKSLTPEKPATPGKKLDLLLTGYLPNEVVTLVLHSTPRNLGTFTADGTGTIAVSLSVPADVEAGDHNLVVRRADGSTVSYPIRIAPAASGARLADTGADVAVPLVLGGALLVAGAATMFVARRRSTGTSQP